MLVERFGGDPSKWRKMKGVAEVIHEDGTVKLAEIHWYQNSEVGKFLFKRKYFLESR